MISRMKASDKQKFVIKNVHTKAGTKTLFLDELGEAIAELNDVLAGRNKACNANELLDILDSVERRNEPTRSFDLSKMRF